VRKDGMGREGKNKLFTSSSKKEKEIIYANLSMFTHSQIEVIKLIIVFHL
jgi:hypothetical protein